MLLRLLSIGTCSALLIAAAAPSPTAEGAAPAVAWSPIFADDPRGEAPCREGDSRTATVYEQDYESAIPWKRFNDGWYRTKNVALEGRHAAGSKLTGKSGTDEHHFLPHRRAVAGATTYLQFGTRGNRAGVKGGVAVNSVQRTFTAGTAWQGQLIDVTAATRDESGWLSTYFEHKATKGKTTYLYIDNAQLFSCRTNKTTRVGEATSYGTAALLAAGRPKGGTVYLASADVAAHSLTAAALAGYRDAPLLLTTTASLPAVTRTALVNLAPARIVIVGGTAAVSSAVENALAALAPSVTRLSGTDAATVAAATAAEYPDNPDAAYLVSAAGPSEAVAISALAAKEGVPLIATDGSSLSPAAATALARLQPARVVAVGPTSSISNATLAAAGAAVSAGTPTTRLTASDIAGLSALIAGTYSSASQSYLTVADDWSLGLAAAATAGRTGAPLLLTPKTGLAPATKTALTTLKETQGTVVGDKRAVSAILRDQYGRTLP
ncbi:MAG: cell wall-binding repeat-containing protein [Micropruina sp.]